MNDEGVEQRWDVMEMERQELAMESLGVSLAEGKTILRGVQDSVAARQMAEYLELQRAGEDVRQVREYLHPSGEHVIDWFHITMRLTVLQQQTQALREERPPTGAAASKQVESVKHLLWDGNVEEALERLANLILDLELIPNHSAPAERLAAGGAEFETYIRNNQECIPNYGERYRQGETISTALGESTINQVVSRRFVKRQQMHRTLRGAHLLLQTRTQVLNHEPEEVFRRRYPLFRVRAKVVCPPGSCCSRSRATAFSSDTLIFVYNFGAICHNSSTIPVP
ncbi:MAG: hypothetical protein ACRD3T_08915 [Terriglobia bacterium]